MTKLIFDDFEFNSKVKPHLNNGTSQLDNISRSVGNLSIPSDFNYGSQLRELQNFSNTMGRRVNSIIEWFEQGKSQYENLESDLLTIITKIEKLDIKRYEDLIKK